MVNEIKDEVNFQCSICKRKIPSFSDKISAWEFEVLGICEVCIQSIFRVYSPSFEDTD